MSKVALFDFDNTLYDGISYFDILRYHISMGLISPSINDQTREVVKAYKTGALSYELAATALLENYATALTGVLYATVLKSTNTFFNQNADKIYPFARPIVTLLQPTHEMILVTASPQFVAKSAADMLGIKQYISSTFEVAKDRFTGKLLDQLAHSSEKALAIQKHMPNIQPQGSFAFGDSEGDKAMLEMVEHAICINPTPGLQQTAIERGWRVATPDTIEQLVRQRYSKA